jgi:hypothetical protein
VLVFLSETVVLDGDLGVQILAAPPVVDGETVDYRGLLDGAEVSLVVHNEPSAKIRGSVVGVVAALADPAFEWGTTLDIAQELGHRVVPPHLGEFSLLPSVRPEAAAFAEQLLDEGVISAAGAELIGLLSFGGAPMLVFLGGAVGAVAVRGAAAPGDLLDAVRRRLAIA